MGPLTKRQINWCDAPGGGFGAELDGRRLTLRVNDFPAEPYYTLLVDGVPAEDFDDWPADWTIAPARYADSWDEGEWRVEVTLELSRDGTFVLDRHATSYGGSAGGGLSGRWRESSPGTVELTVESARGPAFQVGAVLSGKLSADGVDLPPVRGLGPLSLRRMRPR